MSTRESIRNDAKMEPIYKQGRLDDLGDVADILKRIMEGAHVALLKDIDETYWAQTHEALDDLLYEVVREMEIVRDD